MVKGEDDIKQVGWLLVELVPLCAVRLLLLWVGGCMWQLRDHHEGCLGLGDLAGRLVPTMEKGEDDIKQVGWLLQ
jgi:hypothetical protein